MSNNQERKIVEQIKAEYSVDHKAQSKFDELKALDRAVKLPANIFAYSFGIIGALILGFGMCLAMDVFSINQTWALVVGIVVGIVGIVMVSLNYIFYSNILSSRKKKYASTIIAKSDELLNN